jgi:hypothetical protein
LLQVKFHSYITQEILKSDSANLHRAFAIWSVLRSETWFYLDDLLTEFTEKTGKTERTVRRWFNSGEDIFWRYGHHKNRRTIVLIGKWQVMEYYDLPIPGRVILIDEENLFGGLQKLRAHLSTSWMNGKEKAFASRQTIESKIDKVPQTQRNYEKQTRSKSQPIRILNWHAEYAEFKQLPNLYYAVNYAKYYKRPKYRYGFISGGDDTWTTTSNRKLLYGSCDKAKKAASKRDDGQVFGISSIEKGVIYVEAHCQNFESNSVVS